MKRINIYSLRQVKEKGGLYDITSKKINSPSSAQEIILKVLQLNEAAEEKFGILTVDTKHKIAGIHIISTGSLNSSVVHPREVFKAALMNNAASIILFHNHPSGDPSPSTEDINTTKRLKEAGEILGIDVLDHIIIGEKNDFLSFKEQNIM